MMIVDLLQYFKDDPGLRGVTFYPNTLPPKIIYPCAAYKKISTVEVISQGGFSGLVKTRIQFTFFETSYLKLQTTLANFKARVRGYNQTKSGGSSIGNTRVDSLGIESDLDDYNPETQEFKAFIDVLVIYAE